MKLFKITLLAMALCVFSFLRAADEILPANIVFVPQVSAVTDSEIVVEINIKPDYYLYRERLFSLSVVDEAFAIDQVNLSEGENKTDAFFGTQSVWHGGKQAATIRIRYSNPMARPSAQLKLKYQGCQDGVICYPPQTVLLPVTLPQAEQNKGTSLTDLLSRKSTPRSELFAEDEQKLLPEDQAFDLSLMPIDASTWGLQWRIASDYYLYRDKIRVVSPSVATIQLSDGEKHRDKFFGEQEIYRRNQGLAQLYLKEKTDNFTLAVEYQGCAEQGVCYPVMRREIHVVNGRVSKIQPLAKLPEVADSIQATTETTSVPKTGNTQGVIAQLTSSLQDNVLLGMGLLLLAGLALSFTPCVLPMLPILLGIITNQHQVSKTRAALLSSAYALGVAVMMAVFGLLVAKTGINIQIVFQQPVWLIVFATIFILLGLAMLGVFSLAMPSGVQQQVIVWQNRFKDATPSNLFVVGALSTLVVGSCIAPPLIAILAFISTTGDSLKGALYLFALGLGMSLPLVIFATVVSEVPKTGAFSRLVTRLFALLMFGVGLWLLVRLLPGALSLVLWGIFMLIVAGLFWRSGLSGVVAKWLTRVIAVISLVLGLVWIGGGLMGNSNPLNPLTTIKPLPFKNINSVEELQVALRHSSQPVMLDLYADWCVSCQEIEHITFADREVMKQLEGFTLLKLDITPVTESHRQLLSSLDLIGPPALLFFSDGKELLDERHIGTISAQALSEKLLDIKAIK